MFKDFPSLHPLVIHFPVVLILIAVAFQVAVVWKPNWAQIRLATLLIMAGGFFSALLVSTLFHAMITPNAPKEALETFANHEEFAQYTLWTSGIVFLLRGIGIFYITNRRSYEIIILIGAILSALFLSIAGHHGARLTHVFGVGPQGKYLMEEHEHKNLDGVGMIDMKMDGTSPMENHTEKKPHVDSGSTMPKMENMPNMKSNQNLKDGTQKSNMKETIEMKGMDMKKDMGAMKGMDMKKGKGDMKGSDMKKDMGDMKGMDMKKDMGDMKGMDMKKDMGDMKGMDMKKDMGDMKGMDMNKDKGDMKGMDMKKDMGDMKMPSKNAMDTIRFQDNNPLKKKKPNLK